MTVLPFKNISLAIYSPLARNSAMMYSAHYLEIDRQGLLFRQDNMFPFAKKAISRHGAILSTFQMKELSDHLVHFEGENYPGSLSSDLKMEISICHPHHEVRLYREWFSDSITNGEKEAWQFLVNLTNAVDLQDIDDREAILNHDACRAYDEYTQRIDRVNVRALRMLEGVWAREFCG